MVENPWLGIRSSTVGQVEMLRADASQPHNYFWGRDAGGRYLFILRLEESPQEFFSMPKLRGIGVDYYENVRELRLSLLVQDDWEVFHSLCLDLVRFSREGIDQDRLIFVVLERLERWQKLLSRGLGKLLSEQEIRGLLGELLFLRDVLFPHFGSASVMAWLGPEGNPQDFAVRNLLFEVKTHLAGAKPSVVISSPAQLWSGQNSLFLVAYSLAVVSNGGVSLPEVVEDLQVRLGGSNYFDKFESKLLSARYIPMPEYAEHRYLPTSPIYFEVREGFPRILEAAVSAGIEDVKYSIRLDSCTPFEIAPSWDIWAKNKL